MNKLQQLIEPDVHSVRQLQEQGIDEWDIQRYCHQRHRKWNIGTRIFRNMFQELGLLFVHKEFEAGTMVVTVYNSSRKIITQQRHDDPLFALAECAKSLNKEEDFLSALMSGLSV